MESLPPTLDSKTLPASRAEDWADSTSRALGTDKVGDNSRGHTTGAPHSSPPVNLASRQMSVDPEIPGAFPRDPPQGAPLAAFSRTTVISTVPVSGSSVLGASGISTGIASVVPPTRSPEVLVSKIPISTHAVQQPTLNPSSSHTVPSGFPETKNLNSGIQSRDLSQDLAGLNIHDSPASRPDGHFAPPATAPFGTLPGGTATSPSHRNVTTTKPVNNDDNSPYVNALGAVGMAAGSAATTAAGYLPPKEDVVHAAGTAANVAGATVGTAAEVAGTAAGATINAAGAAATTAASYIPPKEDVVHALETAEDAVLKAGESLLQGAKSYLPAAIASYLPGESPPLPPSMPTKEFTGAKPYEHTDGVGALPGRASEAGVALLPEERKDLQHLSGVSVSGPQGSNLDNEGIGATALDGSAFSKIAPAAGLSQLASMAPALPSPFASTSTSLPSTERQGAKAFEHSGGAGALPGLVSEAGVAVLPDQRQNPNDLANFAVTSSRGHNDIDNERGLGASALDGLAGGSALAGAALMSQTAYAKMSPAVTPSAYAGKHGDGAVQEIPRTPGYGYERLSDSSSSGNVEDRLSHGYLGDPSPALLGGGITSTSHSQVDSPSHLKSRDSPARPVPHPTKGPEVKSSTGGQSVLGEVGEEPLIASAKQVLPSATILAPHGLDTQRHEAPYESPVQPEPVRTDDRAHAYKGAGLSGGALAAGALGVGSLDKQRVDQTAGHRDTSSHASPLNKDERDDGNKGTVMGAGALAAGGITAATIGTKDHKDVNQNKTLGAGRTQPVVSSSTTDHSHVNTSPHERGSSIGTATGATGDRQVPPRDLRRIDPDSDAHNAVVERKVAGDGGADYPHLGGTDNDPDRLDPGYHPAALHPSPKSVNTKGHQQQSSTSSSNTAYSPTDASFSPTHGKKSSMDSAGAPGSPKKSSFMGKIKDKLHGHHET